MPQRSTPDVSKLVSLVEYLPKNRDDIVGSTSARQYSSQGDDVLILEGCLAELEAIFLAPDGNERAILLFNLLHRENVMHFALKSLRKL